ncbi:MAG: ornithine cyclodeaminase family protein [Planctomycetota bacterium]|nr:MAG: ornithine cyclodeaminase family protein [Planctomycetota bacterium]
MDCVNRLRAETVRILYPVGRGCPRRRDRGGLRRRAAGGVCGGIGGGDQSRRELLMSLVFLSEADVRANLTMRQVLDALEHTFRRLADGEVDYRPRQRVRVAGAMLHVLPAASEDSGLLAFKCYLSTRQSVTFHVVVYDRRVGAPIAIIEADQLGRLRTGAATGLATKYLARRDARTVGVIGTGRQAYCQVEAICCVREVEQVLVYSRQQEHRERFASLVSERLVPCVAVGTAEEAVRNRDIVVTVTNSRDPVLLGEWLAPGTHVNAVGSNALSRAEIDTVCIQRAAIVACDSREQCAQEAGDFVPLMESGEWKWSDAVELAELIAGWHPGRLHDDQITVFKSVGIALEDLAAATRLLRNMGLWPPPLSTAEPEES